MQAGTYFLKVRRMLLFHAPFIFNTFLASFHAASWDHALATVSPPETDPQIVERWRCADEVHLGKKNPSDGFWSRISVWRAKAFVNVTRWIGFCMSELFRRIDFGDVMSWNTHCRALDDRRPAGPRFNSWSRFLSGRSDLSWLLPWLTTGCRTFSCQSFILFQHSHCTFVIILFGPFTRLFINLTVCPKPTTTLGLVEQAFWRVPLFTERVVASSFEVTLARPSMHSTTSAFHSRTSGSRRFSLILLHERIRRRIWWCNFSTLIDIVAELQFSPLEHCPLNSHCQQSPRILCTRCFVPWFFWPWRFSHNFHFWRQNSYFVCVAPYFFSPSFSICDNQVLNSSDESPGRTIPIRSWVFQTLVFLVLYNPSKISSGVSFRHRQ